MAYHAVSFEIESGFQDIDLEGDAQNIVDVWGNYKAIGGRGIIADTQTTLRCCRSFSLSWIRRQHNFVAHFLLNMLDMIDYMVWLEEVPIFLVTVVSG